RTSPATAAGLRRTMEQTALFRSPPRSTGLDPDSSPGQRRRAKSLSPVGERWLLQPVSERGPAGRARRKRVRFADSLGLELTSIRHYRDTDVPEVPGRVLARLEARTEPPLFPNPGDSPDFLSRVEQRGVCLESIATDDFSITGTVRVLNLTFQKAVLVRYTLNQWRSFVDIAAAYVPDSSDGHTDAFAFKMIAPVFLEAGGLLEFAIRYRTPGASGQERWDNNGGGNYRVRSRRFRVSPPKDWEDAWIHFI
uniref:CBM21 domain-containing protein n=1 Tax=Callorhinchus milii TaxID=7868 RepID=A0A4W3IQN1_CALMI